VEGKVYTPFTDIFKQRTLDQMAKLDMVYPSRGEMDTELSRNGAYIDGLSALFTKYNLTGWQKPLAQLKIELTSYTLGFEPTCSRKLALTFVKIPVPMRLSWRATVSTFLPRSSLEWPTRLSPTTRLR
jgi:hypothetical protein